MPMVPRKVTVPMRPESRAEADNLLGKWCDDKGTLVTGRNNIIQEAIRRGLSALRERAKVGKVEIEGRPDCDGKDGRCRGSGCRCGEWRIQTVELTKFHVQDAADLERQIGAPRRYIYTEALRIGTRAMTSLLEEASAPAPTKPPAVSAPAPARKSA